MPLLEKDEKESTNWRTNIRANEATYVEKCGRKGEEKLCERSQLKDGYSRLTV